MSKSKRIYSSNLQSSLIVQLCTCVCMSCRQLQEEMAYAYSEICISNQLDDLPSLFHNELPPQLGYRAFYPGVTVHSCHPSAREVETGDPKSKMAN